MIEEHPEMSHVSMDTTAFVLIVSNEGQVDFITTAPPEYVADSLSRIAADVKENGFQYV